MKNRRALPITILSNFVDDKKSKNTTLIFIAAVLFSLAHITWSINPFTISFSGFQLAYAFVLVLGIVYGVAYIRTKSINKFIKSRTGQAKTLLPII